MDCKERNLEKDEDLQEKEQRVRVLPYLRDTDEMANTQDPKLLKEKQVVRRISAGVKGNVSPFMMSLGITKRPQESAKTVIERDKVVKKVERLAKKVDNLEYLTHKMLKAKEVRVNVKEIEVPTLLVEGTQEVREDTPQSLVVDHHGASSSGAASSGDKDKERQIHC